MNAHTTENAKANAADAETTTANARERLAAERRRSRPSLRELTRVRHARTSRARANARPGRARNTIIRFFFLVFVEDVEGEGGGDGGAERARDASLASSSSQFFTTSTSTSTRLNVCERE